MAAMPEPPEDAAYVEHPDLDQAVDIDGHGPAFEPPSEPDEPEESE
jgi:hypothetical protein